MRVMDTKRISNATYSEVRCLLRKAENDGNRHASAALSLLEQDEFLIQDMDRDVEKAAASMENIIGQITEIYDRLSELVINDRNYLPVTTELESLRRNAEFCLKEIERVK
jgi:hypothetical protein